MPVWDRTGPMSLMTTPLTELVQPVCRVANDGEARLALVDGSTSGRGVVSLHGTLDGPHCMHARTLPTVFRLHPRRDPGGASAELLITDPCYWTPALPFLYILVVEVERPDGSLSTVSQTVGLRRWHADGANLRLERKRIVLRGAAVSATGETTLDEARLREAALVVRNPKENFCKEASRQGVALVADFRGRDRDVAATLRRCAWEPAVMLALVDDAAATFDAVPSQLLGRVVRAGEDAVSGDRPWASVLAVELDADERPLAWLAACGKPVIAIRRSAGPSQIGTARDACDRLQAELAPEFNLAGYFVASTQDA